MTLAWLTQSPAHSPAARANGRMAATPLGDVLIGGMSRPGGGGAALDNTAFLWTGTDWDSTTIPAVPAGREGWAGALIYDSDRNYLVWVATYSAGSINGHDELDLANLGAGWTTYAASGIHDALYAGGAYDKHRGKAVYYSGFGALTQELDVSTHTWATVSTTTLPGSYAVSIAYDETRHLVVAFGGATDTPDKTSTWDGTTWATLSPARSPSGTVGYCPMAWSAARGTLLLKTDSHTEEWDGTTWTQLTLTGEGYSSASVAYAQLAIGATTDPVLFGGGSPSLNNTTFTLGPPVLLSIALSPGGAQTFGVGDTAWINASGTYSDGNVLDVTSLGTWASSTAHATVSAAGFMTAVSAGTADVTLTIGSVSATCAVTVVAPAAGRWKRYANALPYGLAGALACEIPGKGVFIFSGISDLDPGSNGYDVVLSPESAIGGFALHLDPTTGVVTSTSAGLPGEFFCNAGPVGGPYLAPVTKAGGTRGCCALDTDRNVIVIHFGIYELPQLPAGQEYQPGVVISGVGAVPCFMTVEFDGLHFTSYENSIPRISALGGAWSTYDDAMTYDPDRKKMLLFSGNNSGGGWSFTNGGPVFAWNTTTHVWEVDPDPASQHGWAHTVASYNPKQNRTILFGGGIDAIEEYKGAGDPFDVLIDSTTGGPSDSEGAGKAIVYSPLRVASLVKSNTATYTYTPGPPNPNPIAHQGFGTYALLVTTNEPPCGASGRPYRAVCYSRDALALVAIGGQNYNGGGVQVTTSRDVYVLADPLPVSIAVTAAGSLLAGAATQLTAIGTFADASTADITGLVAWTTSDATIATVDSSGRAHGIKAG